MTTQVGMPLGAGAQRPEKQKNGKHYTWRDAWSLAFYRPSAQTFAQLLQDPQAHPSRALNWLFFSGVAMGLLMVARWFFDGVPEFTIFIVTYTFTGSILVLGLTLLMSRILRLVLTRMGAQGSYDHQLYVTALVFAPMFIVQGVLLQLPAGAYLGVAHVLLWGYALGCWMVGLRHVYAMPTSRLIVAMVMSVVLPLALLVLVF
jgi:hypothetical protein